jgi:hypothetical protein
MTVIVNSNFQGCYLSGKSYTEIRRFIFIGSAGSGVTTAIPNFKQKDVTVIGMSVAPGFAPNDDCIYENVAFQGAATTGTIFGGARSSLKNCKISNAAFNLALSTGLQVEKLVSNRSPSYGLIFTSGSCRQGYNINGVVINNAATADLRCATDGVSIKAYESTLNGTTKLSTTGGAIICQNYNGDTAAVLGSQGGTTYSRDVTTLDTGASSSIRLLINSSSFNTLFPLFWELPTYNHTIASISGNACTVSMRIKKTHATNIAGRLEVKRGVILAADATTDLPSDTNWNTVTVSFTPTADGPVEVYIELWSTATTESIYIDPDSLVFTMGGVSYSNTNHRWNYGLPVTDFRANYSDPAIANVRSGTAYKYEANANNKTGTCAVPAAANVLLGVAVDATTGTFNEAARNVDPGVANVKLATNYKIQNASLTGTLAGGGGASPAYFIS